MKACTGGKGAFGETPWFTIAPALGQVRSALGFAVWAEERFVRARPMSQAFAKSSRNFFHSGRFPYSATYLSSSKRDSLQSDSRNQAQRFGTSSRIKRTVNKLSKTARFRMGRDTQKSGRRFGSAGTSPPRKSAETISHVRDAKMNYEQFAGAGHVLIFLQATRAKVCFQLR